MIIKPFSRFKSTLKIIRACSEHGIKNYTINKDWSIDVNGYVNLSSRKLNSLPLKFRNVSRYFTCSNNSLTSLEGSPEIVGEHFSCQGNLLSSLDHSPKSVGTDFNCSGNRITSFKGFEENSFRGSLICYDNPIFEIYCLNPCKDFIELLNEYGVIKGGNKVIETRLRQAFEDNGITFLPDTFEFENYEVI